MMAMMERKNSVQNLTETIHSLLGVKSHLTSTWIRSVCDIMKSLPSSGSPTTFQPAMPKTGVDREIDTEQSCMVILKLKDELAQLTDCIKRLNIRRQQVLNDYLDLKGNIRVFCRIRPLTVGENYGHCRPVVVSGSTDIFLEVVGGNHKKYSFDKVFQPTSSQDEVFKEVEHVVKSALDGYNACIFAYGQTGTGKTFTMEGTPDFPGVVPRTIEALFKLALDCTYLFHFSMLEIYLGNLRDLLVPQAKKPTDPMPPCLSIQTDPNGGIDVENLVAVQVSDHKQALRLYKLGCRYRSTASTNSNITSSRSHCMIRIKITCLNAPERRRETNKVWLVDLGGSERVLKTKAWGKRLEEGKAINLSLSALGDVINALQRKKRHVPFRNSRLTQVLKDSLGEDSKTLMLVHVSPKEEDLCETICTLGFAARVRSIHLGTEDPREKAQKEVAMQKLQETMANIEDERQKARTKFDNLNKKFESLTTSSTREDEHSTTRERFFDVGIMKNKAEDVKLARPSKLPRFMRATICSLRKSAIHQQNSEEKHAVPARRRRPPPHCAGSVTFPVKSHSEYNSDCSISRSSCLAGLNTLHSADNETEYSQDITECEVKMVVFSEEKSSTNTDAEVELNHNIVCRDSIASKFNSTLYEVNRTQGLNANVAGGGGYLTKMVPAPFPPKATCSGQNKLDLLCPESSDAENLTLEDLLKIDEMEEAVQHVYSRTSASEAETYKIINHKNNFFHVYTEPGLKTSSQTSKALIHTQDSANGSLILEDESSCVNCPGGTLLNRLYQTKDDHTFDRMLIMGRLNSENQSFREQHSGDGGQCFSPVEIVFDSICPEEELELTYLEFPSEGSSGNKGRDGFSRRTAMQRKHDVAKMKSQRVLFNDNANKMNVNASIKLLKAEGNTQKTGILHFLREKFWIIYFSTLLGLGFQGLGFEHEFFGGLTL